MREIISSEMWEQVNKFFLMVKETSKEQALKASYDFFTRIKTASHLFAGIADSTMSHGEAWHFGRLGGLLERADKTSRILDVKYFILLPDIAEIGTPLDDIQWSALLKSASAFEMYRKRFGPISTDSIVDFLILDREFPRAVHHCLMEAEKSLHTITGSASGMFQNPAEQLLGRLRAELNYAHIDEIIEGGLHEFLDDLQTRLNQIGDAIFDTFFALRPLAGNRTLNRENE